jgi:hypothetical protein
MASAVPLYTAPMTCPCQIDEAFGSLLGNNPRSMPILKSLRRLMPAAGRVCVAEFPTALAC